MALPESLFIKSRHTISYIPEEPLEQDKATLRPWIKLHNLKKIRGEWWKGTKESHYGETQKVAQYYPSLPWPPCIWTPRTGHLVAEYYWWPMMGTEVYQYVKGCAQCQQNKVNTQAKKAPLNPITPVENTTIPDHCHGFYCQVTTIRRIQFNLDHHWPWLY